MAQLYADENFPFPVVEKLRDMGHDVITLQEAGYAGQSLPDETVLRYASDDGRILLTINRNRLILIPYEENDDIITPVTIHETDRKQINFRIRNGRFVRL